MRSIVLAAVLQVALAAPAFAQEMAPEIIVRPGPEYVQQRARAFANEVTALSSFEQMARWDRSLCPGIVGMRADIARAMNDRIAQTATRVGLEVGAPGCEANVVIFFSRDADALAREISRTRAVSARGENGVSRGLAALRDFAETSRPVRWWHVAHTRTGDGFEVEQGELTTVRSAGRLRANTRTNLNRVFVIIDATRVSGVQIAALADYVAMTTLAQIDPDADLTGMQSILSLFASPANARPAGLTAWDIAYLEGLYTVDAEAASVRQQQRDVAREMRDQLTAAR